MKPILFDANETSFTSNGLGRIDALSCVVIEERNGQFELEMEVSIDDPHYSDITEGRILLVRHDETQDKQPFDIYQITRPLDGRVTVLAHHISYRTAKITVEPFEAVGIGLALIGLEEHALGGSPFTFWTDKVVSSTFNVEYPRTMRSLLAGEQGSLLDVFGTGEYEWDKFNIKLHLHRGRDSGVVIRYGKDLTELEKTTDASDMWTGVVPYWRGTPEDSNSEVTVMLDEKYIIAEQCSGLSRQMLIPLDLSGTFEGMPTKEQLKEAAESYVANNFTDSIPTSIEFSFINLASLDEYREVAALQRLKLCDTVTVKYDKLGVSNTAKIIRTEFDVLAEKYISMTIGEVAANLDTALMGGIKGELDDLRNSTKKDLLKTKSAIEQLLQDTIEEQTELITGGSGGNVVLKRDGDGMPTDILVMDSPDMNQALQVLRINVNGIGFSSTGITGPYTSAWTLDGRFNADFIATGELNAGLIKAGILTDAHGTNYWNMETGDFRLSPNVVIGDGTELVGTTLSDIISDISDQIDAKVETWAQSSNPASSWDTTALKTQHVGDLWLYTGTSDLTVDGVTIHPQGVYKYSVANSVYSWESYASTSNNVFDLIDGKATIYYGTYRTGTTSSYTPTNVEDLVQVGDMLSNGNTVYICTSISPITWESFQASEGDYFVDTYTGSTYRWNSGIWTKATDYKSAINTLDNSLGTTGIFNRLTNNGAIQGLFMQNGQLYVNASYIQSGTLTLGGANNVNGLLQIKNASGNVIGTWDKDGINVTAGSLNIGNGNFEVSTDGVLSIQSAIIKNNMSAASGGSNATGLILGRGEITAMRNGSEYFSITMPYYSTYPVSNPEGTTKETIEPPVEESTNYNYLNMPTGFNGSSVQIQSGSNVNLKIGINGRSVLTLMKKSTANKPKSELVLDCDTLYVTNAVNTSGFIDSYGTAQSGNISIPGNGSIAISKGIVTGITNPVAGDDGDINVIERVGTMDYERTLHFRNGIFIGAN